MANHKSALKRIRSNNAKYERNRYQHKTTRTWVKRVRSAESKDEAEKLLRETFSKLDKLVKKNIIHKNKAANLKSGLTKHVNSL
jgi:small subunit ribosomal protein S20